MAVFYVWATIVALSFLGGILWGAFSGTGEDHSEACSVEKRTLKGAVGAYKADHLGVAPASEEDLMGMYLDKPPSYHSVKDGEIRDLPDSPC
jgi:hypothetical protein